MTLSIPLHATVSKPCLHLYVLWPSLTLLPSVCMQSFKKWMESYQAELAQKENMGIFTKLGECGLISFSDYMFLLVVLSGEFRVFVCWCIVS